MSQNDIIKWGIFLLSLVSSIFGLAGYAFKQFESRENSIEMHTFIEKRLDQIETKLDQLIDR
jgi:hypothetical protein